MFSNIILLVVLFCPFSTTNEYCVKEDLISLDPKEIITNNLYSLLKTRNSFLNSSEFNEEIAISKYKKSISGSKSPESAANFPQVDFSTKRVFLESCGCHREILVRRGNDGNHSLCSSHATMRGQGQKVVAFSFYGDPDSKRHKTRQYLNGIKTNLEAIKELYPGKVYNFSYNITKL